MLLARQKQVSSRGVGKLGACLELFLFRNGLRLFRCNLALDFNRCDLHCGLHELRSPKRGGKANTSCITHFQIVHRELRKSLGVFVGPFTRATLQ